MNAWRWAQIVIALVSVCAAAMLAFDGIDGWGWFLLLAFVVAT